MSELFQSVSVGRLKLKNRVVMAPMTRSRALGNVPNELMVQYYAARSAAGLLITEGTSPTPDGIGYPRIPGIYSDEQVAGWRMVCDAVHKNGGRIFVQLIHTGRVGHPHNVPAGGRILAPSSLAAPGEMWTDQEGAQTFPVPAEMTEADIQNAIAAYARGCVRADEAGFDGVELHGANGYLIDQFLNTASNKRTDGWGGSVDHRIRFAVEVVRACVQSIGCDRIGIRISPYGVFNGMAPDAEMDALYERLIQELNPLGLAYVHVVDHSSMGAPPVSETLKATIHRLFTGKYILSGGYDAARATQDLRDGKGDLVAFGRPFLANPDLVGRLRMGRELKTPDPATFYTAGAKGYTELL